MLSVLLQAKLGRRERKEKPYPEGSPWDEARGTGGGNPTVGPGSAPWGGVPGRAKSQHSARQGLLPRSPLFCYRSRRQQGRLELDSKDRSCTSGGGWHCRPGKNGLWDHTCWLGLGSCVAWLDSKCPQGWSQPGAGLLPPGLPEPALPLQSTDHLLGAEAAWESPLLLLWVHQAGSADDRARALRMPMTPQTYL